MDSYQKLCQAIRNGKVKRVENLLKLQNVNPNRRSSDEDNPLSIACCNSKGNEDIVKLLITNHQNPADPNTPDAFGLTPFFIAVILQHINVVRVLLQESLVPVNVNSTLHDNTLTKAVHQHNVFVPLITYLLQAGDPPVNKYTIASVLNLSVLKGNLEMVQLLLKNGAKINNTRKHSTIMTAFVEGHTDILEQLLLHNYNQISDNVRWIADLRAEVSCQLIRNIRNKKQSLAVLLRWGIFQYKTRGFMECMFYVTTAATHLGAEGAVMMLWMMVINPWLLQEQWLVNGNIPQYLAQYEQFTAVLIRIRKQALRLTLLCRAKIFKQLGYNPMQKAEQLPLPRSLREFVQFRDLKDLHNAE